MDEKSWRRIVQLLSISLAIILWIFSIKFSMDGFDFNAQSASGYVRFFSLTLALTATLLELIFDEDGTRNSKTLIGFGILAYIYGMLTNFMGIYVLQGLPDYLMNPEKLLFNIIVSVMLELVPEQLLLWGLDLTGRDVRDLVSHVLKVNTRNNRSIPVGLPSRNDERRKPQEPQMPKKRGRPPTRDNGNQEREVEDMEMLAARWGVPTDD